MLGDIRDIKFSSLFCCVLCYFFSRFVVFCSAPRFISSRFGLVAFCPVSFRFDLFRFVSICFVSFRFDFLFFFSIRSVSISSLFRFLSVRSPGFVPLAFASFPFVSFRFLSFHYHGGGGYYLKELVDEATSETPDSVDMKKIMSSPALQQMLSPLPAPPAVSAMGTPIGGLDGVGVGGGHPPTPTVTAG